MRPTLTARDRCDRCGAQAYVVATLPSGLDLFFCAHHAKSFVPGLKEQGAMVYEETVPV